jgi:predicted amidophosphoribosyltransferase
MAMGERRLEREKRTIQAMIEIYCRGRHGQSGGLCGECGQLLNYALERIDKCPYRQNKPTCAKCTIHCYKPQMRDQVRAVMRYAGMRMMFHHPVITFLHYMDEMKHARKNQSCGLKI